MRPLSILITTCHFTTMQHMQEQMEILLPLWETASGMMAFDARRSLYLFRCLFCFNPCLLKTFCGVDSDYPIGQNPEGAVVSPSALPF